MSEPGNENKSSREIRLVRAALKRREAEEDARFPFEFGVDVCCPRCKFGRDYSEWQDKQQRTAAWLWHLLRRRGGEGDQREMRVLEIEYNVGRAGGV